jgi:hypothetical protein
MPLCKRIRRTVADSHVLKDVGQLCMYADLQPRFQREDIQGMNISEFYAVPRHVRCLAPFGLGLVHVLGHAM